MVPLYESLTRFIPQTDAVDRYHAIADGHTPGDATALPKPDECKAYMGILNSIFVFDESHPEMGLHSYADIIGAHGVDWDYDSMVAADVSDLDGRTVAAILVAAMRAEHWSDGVFGKFLRSGAVRRWLLRLREIDQEGEH